MSLQPSASLGAQAFRAVEAYANADRADVAQDAPNSFGTALQQALEGVVKSGQEADTQSRSALMGTGNITDVVTAIAQAELVLQTTLAVRDRVVQAYQDIMRMPIWSERSLPGRKVRGMNESDVAAVLRDAMIVTVTLGGPPLLSGLVVGLAISLLQAVTQINEATLAFVPKVMAIGTAMIVTGSYIFSALADFSRALFARLVEIGAT